MLDKNDFVTAKRCASNCGAFYCLDCFQNLIITWKAVCSFCRNLVTFDYVSITLEVPSGEESLSRLAEILHHEEISPRTPISHYPDLKISPSIVRVKPTQQEAKTVIQVPESDLLLIK